MIRVELIMWSVTMELFDFEIIFVRSSENMTVSLIAWVMTLKSMTVNFTKVATH